MIPKELHKYLDKWDPKKTNFLSLYKPSDHRIDLIKDAKSPARKIYNFSKNQAAVIKEYIDKMTVKGFIRLNNSHYTVPILVMKKLKKGLKVYIDYRVLNTLTIKNRNVFPLIREILSRLYKIKYYSKFDVIAVFNEIRIKKKNKKKTVFLIRYGFFKYLIMPFKLYNAPEIF